MKQLTTYLWFGAMSTTGSAEEAKCSLMNFSQSLLKVNLCPVWLFWERTCCLKCRPVMKLFVCLRVCDYIRKRHTRSQILLHPKIKQNSHAELLCSFSFTQKELPYSTVSTGESHPCCFGKERFSKQESIFSLCAHTKHSSPTVSEKPHLVLVYRIPLLSLKIS